MFSPINNFFSASLNVESIRWKEIRLQTSTQLYFRRDITFTHLIVAVEYIIRYLLSWIGNKLIGKWNCNICCYNHNFRIYYHGSYSSFHLQSQKVFSHPLHLFLHLNKLLFDMVVISVICYDIFVYLSICRCIFAFLTSF